MKGEQLDRIEEMLTQIKERLSSTDDKTEHSLEDKLYTTKEVASILKLTEQRVYQLVNTGRLNKINKLGYNRFLLSHILDYLYAKN